MTLHPPKRISSTEGLGIHTTKEMAHVSESISIGTETWNDMSEPWKEGETIIAEPGYSWVTKWQVGKPYVLTKFFNAEANLVGTYCDISRPVERIGDEFSFTDLYLDVWQPAGKEPIILDQDELEEATKASYITQEEAERARAVAASVLANLKSDPSFIDFQ